MSNLKIVLALLNFIAMVGAIIWFCNLLSWESGITAIGLLGALITQVFTNDEIKSKLKFVQRSNKDSHNYMAAKNINVSDYKKIQKGEAGSHLIQGDIVNVNYGIDERRAREVFHEMNLQLKNDYTKEAFDIACSRVAEFENKLMPKMQAVNGALEAFADPSFQILLQEAQKAAASTERPADYDLLSELLIHRFQKGENRITRAGISRAVEIVDKISDDSLLGLTVRHAVTSFIPVTGDIHQGLDVLNELFSKIIYGKLPTGNEWLDHLDIMDAVRLNSLQKLKKLQQYYPEALSGYVDVGIEKSSENYNKAIEIMKNNKIPTNLLVDHAFNSNYVRINITSKKRIVDLKFQSFNGNNPKAIVEIPLSVNEIEVINSIYDLYSKDENLKQQNIKNFMNEWDKRPYLKTLREWWDNNETSFQITSVGRVLAHSNAQRCDKGLPPLD